MMLTVRLCVLGGFLGMVSLSTGVLAQDVAQPRAIPGCDIRVERNLARMSLEQIDMETELAKQFYSFLPSGGFARLSCLDRLLGGGINVIFSPPDISRIISMIESRVCALAEQQVDRMMQPLRQSVQAGVDVDRLLPGFGMGRVNVGVDVYPERGRWSGVNDTYGLVSFGSRSSRGIFAR